jgi:hypothetical protein
MTGDVASGVRLGRIWHEFGWNLGLRIRFAQIVVRSD